MLAGFRVPNMPNGNGDVYGGTDVAYDTSPEVSKTSRAGSSSIALSDTRNVGQSSTPTASSLTRRLSVARPDPPEMVGHRSVCTTYQRSGMAINCSMHALVNACRSALEDADAFQLHSRNHVRQTPHHQHLTDFEADCPRELGF